MDDATPPANPEAEAADTAAVQDRLARDAAAWSSSRVEAVLPAEAKPPRARAPRRAKPAPVAAPPAPGKPFRMAYDGVSSREYLEQTLVRRGA